MKNFRKVLGSLFLLAVLLSPFYAKAQEAPIEPEVEVETETEAETVTIHLTMRAGEVFFSEDVEVLEDSTVLSVLEAADESSDIFSLSDIQVYSFGSYLKCVDIEDIGEKCDDWQYTVDNDYPSTSIDSTTVSGSGSIYLYFSAKNRVTLSDDSITTGDSVTVTVEKYEYEDGVWEAEDDATVGVTQPDTTAAFNPPIEIMTGEVEENGQITFSEIPVGLYDVGIRDEYGYYFPTQALTVTQTSSSSSGSSSGSSNSNNITKKKTGEVLGVETIPLFDIKKAYAFLLAQQKEDGSWGGEIYTDWATIALASSDTQTYKMAPIAKLLKYLSTQKPKGTNLTDYERHAMALMALGLDPHDAQGENYIQKIVDSFDGKQFGDANEDNDDIFALIVLLNAGYGKDEKVIQDSLAFVLGRQRPNGSWDESIDMTGAGLQALSIFSDQENVKTSITRAKEFLKTTQKKNGSWGDDASSTAWALGGIYALQEKIEKWKAKDGDPATYLATLQEEDGGIKDEVLENRIWKTAYAAAALSGKSWDQTLQNFDKKEIKVAAPAATPKKISAKPKIKTQEIKPSKPEIETLEALPIETELDISEIKTSQTEKSWFAKFLGIFGFN